MTLLFSFFFFQAEDGIRDVAVTGVQTCALPILLGLLVLLQPVVQGEGARERRDLLADQLLLLGQLEVHARHSSPRRLGCTPRPAAARRVMLECRGMAVQALYALQNGFLGFERSGLFFGEFSGERVQIPIACWLIRAPDAILLFDTGLSPRAVPGLMRNDPMARFTEEDLLVNRLDRLGIAPDHVDLVVISHLHFDHAGGAQRSEEHTSELQSRLHLVCRLLLEK